MKKILFMAGLVAGLTLTSCNDFLDVTPSVQLPDDEAITSVPDLQNAVNGVAYHLVDFDNGVRMSYTSEYGIYADLLTNNFKIGKDFQQTSRISNYQLTKNDTDNKNGYFYFYSALGTINKSLSYIPQVKGDEAQIANLKGQLLTWRALLHFDLARMFCRIPSTVKDVNAENSGLVLSNDVFPGDYKGVRSTLKQTYDFIVDDLTKAMPGLSKTVTTGVFNYYGALALRSRVYLYMGEYAKALADAKEVIASGVYQLYKIDEYPSVWSKEGTVESIFELRVNDTHNNDRYSVGYYNDANGYAECQFNTDGKLYKYLSDAANKDVRGKVIKDQSASSYDVPGFYSGKYPGRGSSIYVNNFKIIRLSEVYLIAAEAAYYLSGGAAAAEYVNAIDRNRITDYVDVTTVTIEDIIFAYEKEFFTENQAAFAYWRNKKSVTAMTGDEIGYDDNRTIMPIPQREIDLNGKLAQNPGY